MNFTRRGFLIGFMAGGLQVITISCYHAGLIVLAAMSLVLTFASVYVLEWAMRKEEKHRVEFEAAKGWEALCHKMSGAK